MGHPKLHWLCRGGKRNSWDNPLKYLTTFVVGDASLFVKRILTTLLISYTWYAPHIGYVSILSMKTQQLAIQDHKSNDFLLYIEFPWSIENHLPMLQKYTPLTYSRNVIIYHKPIGTLQKGQHRSGCKSILQFMKFFLKNLQPHKCSFLMS